MTGYYDHVLGLIPVSLIGVTGLLVVYGLWYPAAVFVGALGALVLMLHALFVAAPTVDRRPEKLEDRRDPYATSRQSAHTGAESGTAGAD